jgi:hypothetical protein
VQKKKILIIGFGNMGIAHLNAFANKQFQIYIYDRNNEKTINHFLTIKKNSTKKNITILNNLPNNKKFFLTIISTKSRERFNVFKNFQRNNKSKFFLFEKFVFLKAHNINYVLKNIDHQNIFINSWGSIISNEISKKKISKFFMLIETADVKFFNNITHFMHIFFKIDGYSKIVFFQKNLKILKNLNDNFYNMGRGNIELITSNENTLKIKTISDKNFFFKITMKTEGNDKILINFDNQNNIHIKKNNSIRTIPFPISKKTSYIFLKKLIRNKNNYFPNFETDASISNFLLRNIKAKFI